MQTLIHHMKQKDHWDCLMELVTQLRDSADRIAGIHSCLDEGVITYRQELPDHLVRAFLMIEVAKVKLSVLPAEWNKKVDEVVEELTKDHVNFDTVKEFDSYEF